MKYSINKLIFSIICLGQILNYNPFNMFIINFKQYYIYSTDDFPPQATSSTTS